MARPPKITPIIPPPAISGLNPDSSAVADATPDTVEAQITGSWDYLRTSLGRTVPYNVNRAKAATRRFGQAIR